MTLNFSHHPLLISTLLDNCGATNLVNNHLLLKLGSFVKAKPDKCIEVGTSSLLITGHRKQVLKNVLDRARGLNTKDLILSDMVVVEGFHVNIVLEACLCQAGV